MAFDVPENGPMCVWGSRARADAGANGVIHDAEREEQPNARRSVRTIAAQPGKR